MILDEVRLELLNEAKSSPNLLSDLAGLEIYLAESYHNRSFIELLQNADDAGANKFKIIHYGSELYIANNGRDFNKNDIESICRSAASNKVKGEKIGYRGIGFKSVVGYANEIHIVSGSLEMTFSRNKTLYEIPDATKVPLIRVPHHIDPSERLKFEPIISNLKSEGFTTFFIFSGTISNLLSKEFELFPHRSILFLNNVDNVEIIGEYSNKTLVYKNQLAENEYLMKMVSNDLISYWRKSSFGSSSLVFCLENNSVVKLSKEDAYIHAFLPTDELNGTGILINGNFSTDPSRRHIIYDSETERSVELCGEHINNLMELNLRENNGIGLVAAMIPYDDPRVLQYKNKTFLHHLLEKMKNGKNNIFASKLLSPSWLNVKDFKEIASALQIETIESQYYGLDGFIAFAKYMGAKEIGFVDFVKIINSVEISTIGCAQITNYLCTALLTYKITNELDFIDLNLILSNNNRISLSTLNSASYTIDESFLSLVYEIGLTESEFKQVLRKFAPNYSNHINQLNSDLDLKNVISKDIVKNHVISEIMEATKNANRWRSAEEICLNILNGLGYKLEDVSKQNIGYDLDGFDPNNIPIQIEVKSIVFPGQKFKLTNNEIALAQEKQDTYNIAVVRQSDKYFEIALISNPVKALKLNRQCVQWIWECDSYDYKPIKYLIENEK